MRNLADPTREADTGQEMADLQYGMFTYEANVEQSKTDQQRNQLERLMELANLNHLETSEERTTITNLIKNTRTLSFWRVTLSRELDGRTSDQAH